MKWRREAPGEYSASPYWGRATITKSHRGWSVRVWAYGFEDGLLEDTLGEAKSAAVAIAERLCDRKLAADA